MNITSKPINDPKSFLLGCIHMIELRRYSQRKRDELRQWMRAIDNLKYDSTRGRPVLVLNGRLTKERDQIETEICPFCGTNHFHGTAPGHRATHCSSNALFPDVTHSDGTILHQSDGYILQVK